mgnify:CR=1 FL=1
MINIRIAYILIIIILSIRCAKVQEEDIIPPARVSNLSVEKVLYDTVVLTFRAPGDDSLTGTADRYDLRYSTDERFLTAPERYFNEAVKVEGIERPKKGGSTERISVTGLIPKTKYWFALRSYDDFGNESKISNVTEAITPDVDGGSGYFIPVTSVPFRKIVTDGEKIYGFFPGFWQVDIEEKFSEYATAVTTVSASLTIISNPEQLQLYEAEVQFDQSKFIILGGTMNHILCSPNSKYFDNIIGISKNGELVNLDNKNAIPFGQNGAFEKGISGHRVIKVEDSFYVLGGKKFSGKICNMNELSIINFFKVRENSLYWDKFVPEVLTSPPSLSSSILFANPPTIYVLGGYNLIGLRSNELWKIDTRNKSARMVLPKGAKIERVANGCSFYDEKYKRIYIMGDFEDKSGSIIYFPQDEKVVQARPEGGIPPSFTGCSSIFLKDKGFLLAGGVLYIIMFE